ncbi:MAG: hypothetical protein OXC14_07610 [Rhodospirillaceae bacterium]|nr:hypothetical protein [Rhodospirillaceae bacterium]
MSHLGVEWGLPYDFVRGGDYHSAHWTREKWDALAWSSSDPKPQWDALVAAFREARLTFLRKYPVTFALDAYRATFATAPLRHRHAAAPVYVGKVGIDHMGALLKHAQDATAAGTEWPVAVMRDVEGGTVEFHSPEEAAEMLDPLAEQKNQAESAYNLLDSEVDRLLAVVQDEDGGLDDKATDEEKLAARHTAADELQHMRAYPDAHFARALQKFRELDAGVPDDLDRAKKKLIGRLEAAAMRKTKAILFAAGQRGVELAEACDEQGAALNLVCTAKQKHQILIERADNKEDALTKLAAATREIEAITVERTPWFYSGGGGRIEGDTHEFADASSAFVQARSPEAGKVSGTYTIEPIGDTPANPHATVQLQKTGDNMNFLLGIVEGSAPARFRLKARNYCGPAEIVVTLTPRA